MFLWSKGLYYSNTPALIMSMQNGEVPSHVSLLDHCFTCLTHCCYHVTTSLVMLMACDASVEITWTREIVAQQKKVAQSCTNQELLQSSGLVKPEDWLIVLAWWPLLFHLLFSFSFINTTTQDKGECSHDLVRTGDWATLRKMWSLWLVSVSSIIPRGTSKLDWAI